MDWTNPFIIGPLCMGAGVFVGMLLMRLLDGKKDDAQALAALRDEFDDYRTNVNEHFEQTSELFQGMTEKYRDVYNHLAAGAQQFGNSEASPPRLEIVQPAAQLETDAADATDADEAAAGVVAETSSAPAEADEKAADAAEAVAAESVIAEADSEPTEDAFDPSALDESELADLVEAEAETADPADSEAEPAAADETADAQPDEEAVRVAQNKFRDMPESDDEPVASGSVNGSGKPGAHGEVREEPATQA